MKRAAISSGLLGVLFVLSLVALAPPAAAAPPVTCNVTRRNVLATQGTQSGNHQGLRSTVWHAGSSSSNCARVSALSVVNGNGFVEWLWVQGWIFGEDADGVCGTTSQYSSKPYRLAFWVPTTGGSHCRKEGAIPDSDLSSFINLRLQDGNQDTVWSYYIGDPPSVGSMEVDFNRGNVRTNGERHNLNDFGFAHFKALQWMVSGNTTWFDFTDLDPAGDNDPDWNCIMVSQKNQKVDNIATSCVN